MRFSCGPCAFPVVLPVYLLTPLVLFSRGISFPRRLTSTFLALTFLIVIFYFFFPSTGLLRDGRLTFSMWVDAEISFSPLPFPPCNDPCSRPLSGCSERRLRDSWQPFPQSLPLTPPLAGSSWKAPVFLDILLRIGFAFFYRRFSPPLMDEIMGDMTRFYSLNLQNYAFLSVSLPNQFMIPHSPLKLH